MPPISAPGVPSYVHQIYRVERYKFAICVVPKAGCTFLKQVVQFLNYPNDLIERYNGSSIKSHDIWNLPRRSVHTKLNFKSLKLPLKNFTKEPELIKIVATRNPYTRLYSAYLDKIYIPQLWMKLAAYKNILPNNTDHLCQSLRNETFEGFLTKINETELSNWNDHWLPISVLCKPCTVQPHMVIRQEMYTKDLKTLLEKVHVKESEKQIVHEAIAQQGIQNRQTLKGLIITTYNHGISMTQQCFTKLEIAERVWTVLQLQGQIYDKMPFPYKNLDNIDALSPEQVAEIFLMEADKSPVTADQSTAQRSQAITIAYNNVNKNLISAIQHIFYYDLVVFGYDMNPPS